MKRNEIIAIIAGIVMLAVVLGGVWVWAIVGMSSEVGMALCVTGCVAFVVAVMAGTWGV